MNDEPSSTNMLKACECCELDEGCKPEAMAKYYPTDFAELTPKPLNPSTSKHFNNPSSIPNLRFEDPRKGYRDSSTSLNNRLYNKN